ncbi:hypothetical protein BOTBODRAFT_33229 [Botryobasidium botryosum FD-172 SS1]|uniref:Transmembrane protein n=1 Tax=Botryobasidium botryosum (strain FD-172 SS1) TaxID=930990 RepID=A0A067MDG3_BOTB1|nr:hypothetical protein BOTBODRAFT_33229 [Botryobasidium botryosum FD-172 SS1]
MRFAAIFASVLSLGFLAAAAPTVTGAALTARDADLAVRSENALVARGDGPECDACNGQGLALLDAVANIHVNIHASVQALTDACNSGKHGYSDLQPLIADLKAQVQALVDAVVKAHVNVLGIVNVNILVDANVWASLCLQILCEIFDCLKLALSVCTEAKADIAACIQVCVSAIVQANDCVPNCGQAIIAGLQAYVDLCLSLGVNLNAIL